MSDKKDVGLSIRFIQSYVPPTPEEDAFGSTYAQHLANRALCLGPCRGEFDTLEARLEFLREVDAKATKQ